MIETLYMLLVYCIIRVFSIRTLQVKGSKERGWEGEVHKIWPHFRQGRQSQLFIWGQLCVWIESTLIIQYTRCNRVKYLGLIKSLLL